MTRPRLLDLFCGAGGAAMGYYRAGFEVYGVDIAPQPRYPFRFRRADALETLATQGHRFDAVHASPPCQRYARTSALWDRDRHPDLIPPTRELLIAIGRPWVIENVPGAPLINPSWLCGCTFPELRVYRSRGFESPVTIPGTTCNDHLTPVNKMGRPLRADEYATVVGHFSGVALARLAMGIPWMTRDELREAIPPAYTEYVGRHLMRTLTGS